MRLLIKRSKEAYLDADWVSHVKLVSQVTDESVRSNTDNVRYVVEHIEVFKKPAALDALSTELFGSTLGDFMLEDGKEYLLTGKYYDGKLSCTAFGQVKPEEIEHLVAEWNQIPASFIEEMKTYES
ncbi:hypothetical protein PENTCL1PPCAC_14003 [Pristionchus entomophagus]|uniref:NTR domain-containing protein n=1 Tax=Pristionchus entomophagus TaxID=358040 RepID=A0AAV5TF68_9BILA|nr:hypothetical protein PENTCL1PPCAC_14003 [Pristionchus entomophagus]